MTEKRFMLDDAGELIDKETAQFIEYGEKVCDLLNEQHEKLNVKQEHITHLENKIHRMRKEINKLKELYHYRSADIKRENEQLKEEIKDLNDILARYEEKELKG